VQQGGRYYWYINDRLGTPQKLIAQNGEIVWSARYDAFGRALVDIATVENNLRFPGQYFDTETGLHYNWHRYYDPEIGRYLTPDPIGLDGGINLFLYAEADPISLIDPYGLYSWMEFGYDAADVAAGFGDTISFGLTDWVRDKMGTNNVVNKCSSMYDFGEWFGIAYGFAAGGAAGLRSAGRKVVGKEFSHWVPTRAKNWSVFNLGKGKRFLKSGNKWNGNYVSPQRHYYHDPFRYPKGWKDLGPKWPKPLQQLDRIPNVYKGAGVGGSLASTSANSRGDDCECQ
jgi:RHS repeat-associated protein